ncbi:hypothetical protein F2B00_10690 [Streptomyces parvus]|uniref:hypothetical protein n=1 Tax=Streptomyces parvus TaxID=66428 RepID=UPI001239E80C|nr:hypothetical protein [Streptomyces parvus]KAA6202280.1 hypothetical protein F2B00_10690 [Streptomyces parvus]
MGSRASDRDAAALAETGLGGVEVDRLDLLGPASVSTFTDHWLETDGPFRILVNCAGATPLCDSHAMRVGTRCSSRPAIWATSS